MSQEDYLEIRHQLEKKGKNLAWIARKLDISSVYVIDLLKGRRSNEEKKAEIKFLLKMEGIEWNYQ